jgi:hypothetical protein
MLGSRELNPDHAARSLFATSTKLQQRQNATLKQGKTAAGKTTRVISPVTAEMSLPSGEIIIIIIIITCKA